ncbi:glycerate kinase [Hydrogenophaga sp. ZJX-1]|uniref:glycerate kinase n=1 Tax=Hydrogenophaga sp. ZJX-1 TaxID=3404778 RepID=UPI003B27BB25
MKKHSRSLLFLAAGLVLFYGAWRAWGWPGLAAAGGGLLMWLLLHFTRLMNIMQRAAKQPIGFVASAVMLNAKLKPGVTLMHVIAMTRALGERLTPEGEQPEQYRWTDASQSSVTAHFRDGRLVSWDLARPAPEDETAQAPATGTAP